MDINARLEWMETNQRTAGVGDWKRIQRGGFAQKRDVWVPERMCPTQKVVFCPPHYKWRTSGKCLEISGRAPRKCYKQHAQCPHFPSHRPRSWKSTRPRICQRQGVWISDPNMQITPFQGLGLVGGALGLGDCRRVHVNGRHLVEQYQGLSSSLCLLLVTCPWKGFS